MFSATEYQYIQGLTQSYYSNDYQHYLCITNNPTGNSNNNVYDVICYYSKDNLSINSNSLSVPGNSIKCSFDSNNYSDNNTIDKLVCENYSGTVSLSTKEYVYSNVDSYSDIIGEYQLTKNYFNNLQLISYSILMVVILMFLVSFIRKILGG